MLCTWNARLLRTSLKAFVVERLPLVTCVPCPARRRATQLIARLSHVLARTHLGDYEGIRRGRPSRKGTNRRRRVALIRRRSPENPSITDAAIARLALAVSGGQGKVTRRMAHGGVSHPVRPAHGLPCRAATVRSIHARHAARNEDQAIRSQHGGRVRGAVW